ncbi:hypothetical protein NDU88_004093 [Pleurodeles waltl]|uniref:Uncharacterized protein n=1 Tax=Pleurodeles waltl TaxID=8319 RepID=A0AAV7V4A8_PLEWA|nr:hypothetical protein NDU88_004093 [Pleurodeles waltl]
MTATKHQDGNTASTANKPNWAVNDSKSNSEVETLWLLEEVPHNLGNTAMKDSNGERTNNAKGLAGSRKKGKSKKKMRNDTTFPVYSLKWLFSSTKGRVNNGLALSDNQEGEVAVEATAACVSDSPHLVWDLNVAVSNTDDMGLRDSVTPSLRGHSKPGKLEWRDSAPGTAYKDKETQEEKWSQEKSC